MSRARAAREPVAVVAAGLKAPGGNSPDELWNALCEGRSFAEHFVDERLPDGVGVLVSRVTGFDPAAYLSPIETRRLDRAHQLAIGAAQDALSPVTGRLPAPERCAVVCGVGFGAAATYESQFENLSARGLHALSPLTAAITMPSCAAALLSMRFGFTGPSLTVSAACASGATAIGEAAELLRRGAADLVLAGGVDSLVNYGTLCAFLRLDAMTRNLDEPALASRPFDIERDGFLMGEGAGFVVLQRLEAAQLNPIGQVLGYGASADAHHLVAPPPDGEGALRAMRLALADADATCAEVNHINAHGTSTQLNDLSEAKALFALFGGNSPPVTANKGTTGHLIGGSGAVEAIMTLWSLRQEQVPPIAGLRTVDPAIEIDAVYGVPRKISAGYGLTNSFGFGGANTALLLSGSPAIS
jgi:3-oxoacyl-[acyl-carrier-protein] synthase II